MFHENLKKIRRQNILFRKELAQKVQAERRDIADWEKGRSVPDARMLQKLADALGVDPGQLLGAKINPEKKEEDIAWELDKLNRAIALREKRSRRMWKNIGQVLLVILALNVFVLAAAFFALHLLETTNTPSAAEEVTGEYTIEENTAEEVTEEEMTEKVTEEAASEKEVTEEAASEKKVTEEAASEEKMTEKAAATEGREMMP